MGMQSSAIDDTIKDHQNYISTDPKGNREHFSRDIIDQTHSSSFKAGIQINVI